MWKFVDDSSSIIVGCCVPDYSRWGVSPPRYWLEGLQQTLSEDKSSYGNMMYAKSYEMWFNGFMSFGCFQSVNSVVPAASKALLGGARVMKPHSKTESFRIK
jgi:hypothetical protein